MSPKTHKMADFSAAIIKVSDSDCEHHGAKGGQNFTVAQQIFIRLGKEIAPAVGSDNDRTIAELALAGIDPGEIAHQTGQHPSEITLRLVELCLGPLGRIRPVATASSRRGFQDMPVRRSASTIPECQQPILSLAAGALGGKLQRLGDRLFLAGRETSLPEIVRHARANGIRIRYPRIDPMEAAWSGGPSRRDRRLGRSDLPWGSL